MFPAALALLLLLGLAGPKKVPAKSKRKARKRKVRRKIVEKTKAALPKVPEGEWAAAAAVQVIQDNGRGGSSLRPSRAQRGAAAIMVLLKRPGIKRQSHPDVAQAQRQMGRLKVDGILGKRTIARARELLA